MRSRGPRRMRRRAPATPPGENRRNASACVRLAFRAWMVAFLTGDVIRAGLAEMDPEANDRGDQKDSERQIDCALAAGLALEMKRGHRGSVELLVDGSESQARDFFALGSRVEEADDNQDHGANHEHEDRVVKKVHVHKKADRAGIVMMSFIQDFKNEAHRPQDKTNEQGTDGPLSV